MSQTTKRALSASLQKMLRQRPLNKITVTDIAEDCSVSRMTFYYHFKDIYDLIDWTLNDNAAHILEKCKGADSSKQILLTILRSLQEKKAELTNLMRSVQQEEIETYLYKMIHSVMEGSLSQQSINLSITPEDRAFVLDFYTYASVGLLLAWVKSGMETDPEQLVNQLLSIITADRVLNDLEHLHLVHTKGSESAT